VSGTLQPVRQAIVKGQGGGDVKQVTTREGEAIQAGQVLARIDTTDLEARLIDRIGALESAKAQLALAEKTRAMNVRLLNDKFISQNAFDSANRAFSVAKGNVKSAEAQVQLARNALKDADAVAPLSGLVAKRHVQPGEKVAIESPLVTIVDLRDLEVQALVPAVDVPELRVGMPVEFVVDGFGDRRFTGRIERINPSAEAARVRSSSTSGCRTQRRRCAAACSPPAASRSAASAPMPTLPLSGGSHRGGSELRMGHRERQARAAHRADRPARRHVRAHRDQDLRSARLCRCSASRFDNLKDGAPAMVKAPTSSQNALNRKPRGRGVGRRAMWITRVSINNPVFATMVMVGITVLGCSRTRAWTSSRCPDTNLPFVFVQTVYPGASPEAVEVDVTKPIEYAINQVAGVKLIRSNSTEGLSGVFAEFRLSTNMAQAMQDVRDKIATVRPGFPKDVKDPLVVRADQENSQPVAQLAVMSETVGLRELTSLTDQTIVKALENLPGVARVNVNGRVTRQILIQIKPEALTALGIGVDQVISAIREANQDVPAGRLTRGVSDSIVRVEGKVKDPTQFGRIVVAQQGGGPVYLDAGRERHRRREGPGVLLAHQRAARHHDGRAEGARTPTSSRRRTTCAWRSTICGRGCPRRRGAPGLFHRGRRRAQRQPRQEHDRRRAASSRS
jgi:biotin carboxyl carrier protein